MADEALERVHETPKVEREAFEDSEAAKAADHVEPPAPDPEVAEVAEVEDVSVKLNPDVFSDSGTQSVAVAGFEDVKLYESKAVKLPQAHAYALESAGVAVRSS